MNVTIVDYQSGNISSVINSFTEVAKGKVNIEVTSDIKKIKLDFLLNLNKNEIEIDNLKIDASSNKTANDYIIKFNSKKKNIFNKVIFKNSIKEFFENLQFG